MGYFGCLVAVHDSCFRYHGPPSRMTGQRWTSSISQSAPRGKIRKHRGVCFLPLAQGRWMYSAAPSTELDCDVGRQGEELPDDGYGAPRAERIKKYILLPQLIERSNIPRSPNLRRAQPELGRPVAHIPIAETPRLACCHRAHSPPDDALYGVCWWRC